MTGAYGAARAAGFGKEITDINKNDLLKIITPSIDKNIYYDSYNRWKEKLTLILNK